MEKYNINMAPEHSALLRSRNYNFKPLATNGHLDILKAVGLVWHPLVAFLYTFLLLQIWLRYQYESVVSFFYWLGTVVLVIQPTMAVLVLLLGVCAAKVTSGVRWSAVVYWTWWPFWKCALVYLAVILGTTWGNSIWYYQTLPYTQIGRLQTYTNINPAVGGMRLQDAGLVTFNSSVGVDRSRNGCLKNGATWCVAPIVHGGNLPATEPYPSTNVYDLFVVGMDCCSCPGEFRCGAWNVPGNVGGYRVVDLSNREFYRLASEDFASTYGRTVRHPIFFEWVPEPTASWQAFRTRGTQLMWLGVFTSPCALLTIALVLNGALKYLAEAELASPQDCPMPPPGLGRALSSKLLPQMHRYYTEEQTQSQVNENIPHDHDPRYVLL